MAGPYWLFVESRNAEVGPVCPDVGDMATAAEIATARADLVRAATCPDFSSRWRIRPVSGEALSPEDTEAWAAAAIVGAFEVF
jgi:hypothetical protein